MLLLDLTNCTLYIIILYSVQLIPWRKAIQTAVVDHVLREVKRWASACPDVYALMLVGSWARGNARPDSDLDLMLLVADPGTYRQDTSWLRAIDWTQITRDVAEWGDEEYGVVWSRRVRLDDGSEIEFSFGPPDWAAIDSVDAGTAGVVRDGSRILFDPHGLLQHLVRVVNTEIT